MKTETKSTAHFRPLTKIHSVFVNEQKTKWKCEAGTFTLGTFGFHGAPPASSGWSPAFVDSLTFRSDRVSSVAVICSLKGDVLLGQRGLGCVVNSLTHCLCRYMPAVLIESLLVQWGKGCVSWKTEFSDHTHPTRTVDTHLILIYRGPLKETCSLSIGFTACPLWESSTLSDLCSINSFAARAVFESTLKII